MPIDGMASPNGKKLDGNRFLYLWKNNLKFKFSDETNCCCDILFLQKCYRYQ